MILFKWNPKKKFGKFGANFNFLKAQWFYEKTAKNEVFYIFQKKLCFSF